MIAMFKAIIQLSLDDGNGLEVIYRAMPKEEGIV